MKKRLLAMMMAAMMLTALAIMPAAADDTAVPAPAGTDLFADKNPGFENTTDDGDGGWEESTMWDALVAHDTSDPNYREEFGTRYMQVNDAYQGTSGPNFDGLEGGRHYYFSFYVRNAKIRDEGTIRFNWRLNNYAYDKTQDLEYKWSPQTQVIGINTPDDTSDDAEWYKLTYDLLIPPNADGFTFTIGLNSSKDTATGFDCDNFSLIAGEEYITDNIIRNGNLDAFRKGPDFMWWDEHSPKNSDGVSDGKGGYAYQTTSKGTIYQNVYLIGGKKYTLSYLYRNTLPGNLAFGLDDYKNATGYYYGTRMEPKANGGFYEREGVLPTVENTWERYSVTFTAPGEAGVYAAHKLCVGTAFSYYGGTVQFDDIVLVEAEDASVSYAVEATGTKFEQDNRWRDAYVDAANAMYWKRGFDAEKITDFTAADGAHPVKAMGYYYPKTVGEKVSMVTAVYNTVEGKKQLASFEITEVEAADLNPLILKHSVNVPTADAQNAEVESFIWGGTAGITPVNGTFSLGA